LPKTLAATINAAAARPNVGRRRRRGMSWRAKLRRDWPLIVLTAPAVLLLLIFHYVPLLGGRTPPPRASSRGLSG
jgi:hypothetical protein